MIGCAGGYGLDRGSSLGCNRHPRSTGEAGSHCRALAALVYGTLTGFFFVNKKRIRAVKGMLWISFSNPAEAQRDLSALKDCLSTRATRTAWCNFRLRLRGGWLEEYDVGT